MNLSMNPVLAELSQQAAVTFEEVPTPPAQSPVPTPVLPQAPQQLNERERMVQSLAKDNAGKPHAEILHRLGKQLGPLVIKVLQSQAPTVQQAFGRHQRAVRAANAEFGKDLAAAGIQVQHHSEKEFTQVLFKQLDMLRDGANPSVNALLHAAFPDSPKKAMSIGNSRHGNRWKKAYKSEGVRNHPVEIAMQLTHGGIGMNQRCAAGTFRQSLGINATLFMSCDRITKLEARVQLLEQQMQSTKNREALADAGATTSEDKVLALYAQGKKQTEIARLLEMKVDAVKYHLKKLRSKHN